MKPALKLKRVPLRAVSLDMDQLKAASGGRGTVCGVIMHCDNCGHGWGVDGSGSYGYACPNCGLGINDDGGGGGGGGGCY